MADITIERSSDYYGSRWITEFFHSLPHYNFQFEKVNSTFDPELSTYQEALILWAFAPLLICVIFWLIFTLFFIVRCCQRPRSSKTAGSVCPKVFTGFMVFFTLCLVGVSFYENEQAHKGVDKVFQSVSNINSTVEAAARRIDLLQDLATDISDRLSINLQQTFEQINNVTLREDLLNQVKKIQQESIEVKTYLNVLEIRKNLHGVDDFINIAEDIEYYRWLITIVILCLYVIIFIVTFIGLVTRSCSIFICSTILSVFCSVFIWINCGAYLGSSVALGDVCNGPDTYVLSLVDSQSTKDIVIDYVKCSEPDQPYESEIVKSNSAITEAMLILNSTVRKAKPYHLQGLDGFVDEMNADFDNSIGNLSTLLSTVGRCAHLHRQYLEALDGGCDTTFTAVALLALLSIAIALCSVTLIFSSAHVWRQYRKHRLHQSYQPVDDTDPFLPHPPPYDSDYGALRFSSPTPWSERAALQANASPTLHSDDGVMMLPRHQQMPSDESPPPAYHPGRFVQKYAGAGPPFNK